MARGRCAFTQSDVTRLLKGAKAAGVEVARIEFDKGKIVAVTGKLPGIGEDVEPGISEGVVGECQWDAELKE